MMWQMGGMGMIWMLLFWVGIVVLVVWAVRSVGDNTVRRDTSNRAMEILEERYARGEIDRDEFHTRRSDLERG
ncbi:MAG: SHOCT domain-containing protein [Actinomycetota bacterium]|nr:SHOCT domain-containing protein [Actinomycetota bacterium]MDK1097793.1 SHOCT domain-containing protein [Actinomycetota bacterium]